MGTEDNPEIKIEYGNSLSIPPSSWTELQEYSRYFLVEDAGLLKVAMAKIVLKNKYGMFTDGGPDNLDHWRPIRIRVDMRGTWDTLFYGRCYRDEGLIESRKIPELTLIARGLGQKLLEDTITKAYYDEYTSGQQNWMIKTMIDHFLMYPDSSWNTGITLDQDGGIIVTTPPKDNFERTSLLDALRNIAEAIDYDGYVYEQGGSIFASFRKIGTVATNPYVTLDHPFIWAKPVRDIEEVKNYIFPWGDVDVGVPFDQDRWTEKDITNNWDAFPGCYVATDTEEKKLGNKSVKIFRNDNMDKIGGVLIIPSPDSPVDVPSGRFKVLSMQLTWFKVSPYVPIINLEDDASKKIEFKSSMRRESFETPIWNLHEIDIGPSLEIVANNGGPFQSGQGPLDKWYYTQGASNFSWKITKVDVWREAPSDPSGGIIRVDGLVFFGGLRINPLEYPGWNVVRTDPVSRGKYGNRVYHHGPDYTIRSFEQAGAIADYILKCNKDRMDKFQVKTKAKTWMKPNQYLTLNLPEYGITNPYWPTYTSQNQYWRTTEVSHEWNRPRNLRTTLTLVPKDQSVGSQAYLADEIVGLLKYGRRVL